MHACYVLKIFVCAHDLFAHMSNVFVSSLIKTAVDECLKAMVNCVFNK